MQISGSTTSDSVMSESSLSGINDNASLLSEVETPASVKQQRNEDVSNSIAFRAMITFQVLAYGSYSILVHLCEQNGTIAFSSTTMNFVLELFKLLFSLGALACCTPISSKITIIPIKGEQATSWWRQSLPYSIPGLLYFINNNLAVHMQVHMDPASYQILSNFKIVTTAILYRLIIKQKLSRQQWFAISLLFFGGLAYSLGTLRSSKKTTSTLVMSEMYIHPIGFPMIMTYCTLSGLAGVYNEWILKKYYSESLHMQNVFLYTYGTLLNIIPALGTTVVASGSIYGFNPFGGFSIYTWLIIFSQALNGLFMSVVIKHSSNIIRLFVISFSLIVTAVLSVLVFHITLNIYFFISFVTMICALSLYYNH